ncbi:MAG: 30S ribosomal protein S18 [candidate division NC10 bacterium]
MRRIPRQGEPRPRGGAAPDAGLGDQGRPAAERGGGRGRPGPVHGAGEGGGGRRGGRARGGNPARRRRSSFLKEAAIPTAGARPVKRRRFGRRKVCKFCVDKVDLVDYKDVRRLRGFVSDRGKIVPRRISGSCARHQRQLTRAIRRARSMALLPYTAE